MKLAEDRFSKGSYNFRRCVNCVMESTPRYSYETAKALYDVIQLEGLTYYRKNGMAWKTQSDDPIHKAIVKHFKLIT